MQVNMPMTNEQLIQFLPYLPHHLNININNYKCDYVGIKTSHLTGFYMLGGQPHFTYGGGSVGKSVNEFTPILRPMKELEPFMYNFYQDTPREIQLLAQNGELACAALDWLYAEHFDVFGLMDTIWTKK